MRAVWLSLGGLAATGVTQGAVVAISGAVALLGDTLHNSADALTAVPPGLAFVPARRPPTRSYTYGYGRAEDLAAVAIVVAVAGSSIGTAGVAIERLLRPRDGAKVAPGAGAALAGVAVN